MSGRGHIPQHKIDEVRAAADVVEIVGRRVKLAQKGRDWWGLCPFHGDKDPSLKVDRGRGTWYCFGCGEGGSAFTFLMKDEGLSFPEAVRLLAQRYGVELPRPNLSPEEKQAQQRRERLLRVLEAAGKFFSDQLAGPGGRAARDYLHQKRRLEPATVEAFGLGWAPDAWEALGRALAAAGAPRELLVEAGLTVPRDRGQGAYDRFRGRVMFPIRDATGRVVSFGGRLLAQGEPKYLNGPESPVFAKSRTLYNLHAARPHMRKRDRALVVEGYFDVITCAACGFPEVVAPMGTALTPQQVRRLKGQAAEAVLVFDGDQAGLRAARRSLPVFLGEGLAARVLLLPSGEDPDTFLQGQGPEAFERAVEAARPLVEVVLEEIAAEGDTGTPEGKSRVVGQAGEVLKQVTDPVARWGHLERLARRLELPAAVVAARLGLPAPGRSRPPAPSPPAKSAGLCFDNDRCALELAFSGPRAARVLAEGGALDELADPELAQVAEAIKALLAEGGEPTAAAVADRLAEASLAGLAGGLAQAAVSLEGDAAEEEARLFLELHQRRLAKRRQSRERLARIRDAAGGRSPDPGFEPSQIDSVHLLASQEKK